MSGSRTALDPIDEAPAPRAERLNDGRSQAMRATHREALKRRLRRPGKTRLPGGVRSGGRIGRAEAWFAPFRSMQPGHQTPPDVTACTLAHNDAGRLPRAPICRLLAASSSAMSHLRRAAKRVADDSWKPSNSMSCHSLIFDLTAENRRAAPVHAAPPPLGATVASLRFAAAANRHLVPIRAQRYDRRAQTPWWR